MHFENHEIAFDVPDDWNDESRVMFVFPEAHADVCLARHPVDPAMSLDDYASAFVHRMASRVRGLRVLARGMDDGGTAEPGFHVVLEWIGARGRERCACRLFRRGHEIWALTGSAPVNELEAAMPGLSCALKSFSSL